MSKQAKFISAILVQISVIVVIVLFKMAVLNGGTDVMLRILPVDPRDPLRGDYVTFQYEISDIESSVENYRNGETVYVSLGKTSYEKWESTGISHSKPSQGVFIKGTVDNVSGDNVRIVYGIEQYFIPEGTGRNVVFRTSDDPSALVTVDNSGNAVIQEIFVNGKHWPPAPEFD